MHCSYNTGYTLVKKFNIYIDFYTLMCWFLVLMEANITLLSFTTSEIKRKDIYVVAYGVKKKKMVSLHERGIHAKLPVIKLTTCKV